MQNDYKKNKFKKRWSRKDFYVPGNSNAVKVPDESPGALEKSLRYMRQQIKDSGTMERFKDIQEFTKPSAKNRVKMKNAKYKQRLRDKISKKFWDEHVWLVPKNFKSKSYGPTLPE